MRYPHKHEVRMYELWKCSLLHCYSIYTDTSIHFLVSSAFNLQNYFTNSLPPLMSQSMGCVSFELYVSKPLSSLFLQSDLECMLLKPPHSSCI